MVVFILSGKTPVYAEVKRVGDTVLAKQCVQTLSNICLKIRPKVFNKPVIFLGPDVTHPPAGGHLSKHFGQFFLFEFNSNFYNFKVATV